MAKKKLDQRDVIQIGGLPWTVIKTSELFEEDANGKPTKEVNHGETDCDLRIIKINTSFPEHIQLQTLWHECLHVVLYMSGHSQILAAGHEESLVIAMENMLYPLIAEFWRRGQEI